MIVTRAVCRHRTAALGISVRLKGNDDMPIGSTANHYVVRNIPTHFTAYE